MCSQVIADLEKTGILGSRILRNIFQNHTIEEHFKQSSAYFQFYMNEFACRLKIILKMFYFASFHTLLFNMFNVLNTFWK